jgi:deoxyribodipyrimidine photo-lyase
LGGLACVHEALKAKNIPLHIVMPSSHETVGETIWREAIEKYRGELVITDFSPLRHYREHTELQLASILSLLQQQPGNEVIPLVQVDAHNVVPVWVASDKREYGARTIRPKIHRLLDLYLHNNYPRFKDFAFTANNRSDDDIERLELPDFRQVVYEDYMKMDDTVKELAWAKPGTDAALDQAEQFFNNGLKNYDKLRNDPTQRSICSTLSPWLNHGHVSFQRLALGVKKLNKYPDGTKAFLEEGIIRRELSDNFLYYAPTNYDSLTCAYDWARETLRDHAADRREYLYTWQELERGETYDDLWNAAQLQAVVDGKMHGFLRMYWAKKILEWTESPEAALKIAQYLNDKFNIDGRDPNGFVGVGWSIMGIHDQGWKEREVWEDSVYGTFRRGTHLIYKHSSLLNQCMMHWAPDRITQAANESKFAPLRFVYCSSQRSSLSVGLNRFKVPEFVARYKSAATNAVQAARKRPPNSLSEGSIKKKQKAT